MQLFKKNPVNDIESNLKLIQSFISKYPAPWVICLNSSPRNPDNPMTLGFIDLVAHEFIISEGTIQFATRDGGDIMLPIGLLHHGTSVQIDGKETLVFFYRAYQQNINPDFFPEMTFIIQQH